MPTNTPTVKEILNKRIITFPSDEEMSSVSIKRNVIKAMEEYASIVAREAASKAWDASASYSGWYGKHPDNKNYLETHHPLKP